MASLFRNRFSRPAAPRRRRVRAAAPAMPLERLEPRLALAGDTFSRPMLERATTLVMDASIGPSPVVMSKSQVVGNEVKSFVISHVPEGSVVEKWDAATEKWIDVSTKPTSSNPQELMRLLGRRVIQQGDKIQWRPKAGSEGAVQQAFQMINWDDGSELLGASAEAPSAVQNLAVNPTGVAELTVTWEPPATGDATSYSVTINSGSDPVTYFTSNTSYTFSGLNTGITRYTFSVTASNAEGTSPAANVSYPVRQTAIDVGAYPYALTTGLDGSIWVANSDSNTVQQIVKDNGVWTAQPAIGVGLSPQGLTTGLDGSIWVSNFFSNTVQQIMNDNGVWTAQAAIGVGTHPWGLTTGLDGSIWVANNLGNTVQQIVNDNGVWTAQPAIEVGFYPQGLTAGLDGSIWVAIYSTNTVVQIMNDNGDWTAQPAINLGTVGYGAMALTTGLDGSIWVSNTDANSNTVQQIVNANGVWTAQAAIGVGKNPLFLTTGLDGSIWVSNEGSGTVQQIVNDNGVWAAHWPGILVTDSDGLTTGLDGSIWVANYYSNTVGQIIFPPNAPREIAAAFGPGPGQMTLSWQPPVIVGGTDGISYIATVSQGTYLKTITTSDTSCVFDSLTLGTGPTYFTVTATNFLGESKAVALQIDAFGNTIPTLHRGIGITTDGVPATDGGFDGSGNTYSWTALGDTSSGGALVGNTLVFGGLTFEVNPNQPDFIKAAGQDIEATGSGNVLTLAAAAVNGNQTDQQFTLNFTDGTSATWTQSFSDWLTPQSYLNELTVSTQSYRNTASGGTNDTTNYIYSYSYALPAGKTLESITLPNNADVRLLGAVLTSPQAVDLTWDEWGIANGKTNVSNSDGFDGNGNYYYSGTDVVGDLPSPLVWGGVIFDYGPTSTTKHGTDNFVRASGQEISITAGTFSSLCLAAAAANGSQTDQVFTLKFSDGSQETWTQSLSDWCVYEAFDGQSIASTQDYRVRPNGNTQEITNYVYGYAYQIPEGKTLTSITLPNNSDVGILAMTLV
jgi:streptogramin lyase